MPKLSASAHPLKSNQIENQYVINFREAKDLNLLGGLSEYIETQKHCFGADPENEISLQYISEIGDVAILSGTFDKRIFAWISKRVGDKGKVDPNISMPSTTILTVHTSPWFVAALYCRSCLLIILFIGDLQERMTSQLYQLKKDSMNTA